MKITKIPQAAFAIALVCFLLPFVELACQGQKLAVFTGLQLATGTTVQEPQMFGPPKERPVPADFVILGALVATILGLTLSAKPKPSTAVPTSACGVIAAVALLIFKARTDRNVLAESAGMIQPQYSIGFWGAFLASGGAGLFAYMRRMTAIQAGEVEASNGTLSERPPTFTQDVGE